MWVLVHLNKLGQWAEWLSPPVLFATANILSKLNENLHLQQRKSGEKVFNLTPERCKTMTIQPVEVHLLQSCATVFISEILWFFFFVFWTAPGLVLTMNEMCAGGCSVHLKSSVLCSRYQSSANYAHFFCLCAKKPLCLFPQWKAFCEWMRQPFFIEGATRMASKNRVWGQKEQSYSALNESLSKVHLLILTPAAPEDHCCGE